MRFVYSKKAQDFIKSQGIERIFIKQDPKMDMGCCGISTIKLLITTKGEVREGMIEEERDYVTTYYDQRLDNLLMNYHRVEISVFGFGSKKIFYTETEFSPLNA